MCLKPRDTTTDKAKSKGLTARHQAGRVDSEIPGLWPPGWSCGLRDPRPVATRLVGWAQRTQPCGHQADRCGLSLDRPHGEVAAGAEEDYVDSDQQGQGGSRRWEADALEGGCGMVATELLMEQGHPDAQMTLGHFWWLLSKEAGQEGLAFRRCMVIWQQRVRVRVERGQEGEMG